MRPTSTVSGDANIYFYRELARQGVAAAQLLTMTLSIGEGELKSLPAEEIKGHLAAWSYFHEIDSAENRAFVSGWRRFTENPTAVTDDPMEASWLGFNFWKGAVGEARTTEAGAVRQALCGLRVKAPSGVTVMMDPSNHHLHKPALIGRMTAGQRIVPKRRPGGAGAVESLV